MTENVNTERWIGGGVGGGGGGGGGGGAWWMEGMEWNGGLDWPRDTGMNGLEWSGWTTDGWPDGNEWTKECHSKGII